MMYLFLGVIVLILVAIIAAMASEIGSYKKKLQNRNYRIGELLRQNLHLENSIEYISEKNNFLSAELTRLSARGTGKKEKG